LGASSADAVFSHYRPQGSSGRKRPSVMTAWPNSMDPARLEPAT